MLSSEMFLEAQLKSKTISLIHLATLMYMWYVWEHPKDERQEWSENIFGQPPPAGWKGGSMRGGTFFSLSLPSTLKTVCMYIKEPKSLWFCSGVVTGPAVGSVWRRRARMSPSCCSVRLQRSLPAITKPFFASCRYFCGVVHPHTHTRQVQPDEALCI